MILLCIFNIINNVNGQYILSHQLVNLPEPVTLDLLDAEVEDSNKEEVSTYCL